MANFNSYFSAILDPRFKMRVIDFCFAKLYFSPLAQRNKDKVKQTLYALFNEYCVEYDATSEGQDMDHGNEQKRSRRQEFQGDCEEVSEYWNELQEYIKEDETGDTVQALMCGGDWLRKKFKVKEEKITKKLKAIEITLPDGGTT
ncbi:hypothetical protein M569_10625 [Genlisea aurea]|uniref:hAT-like transposase RNase-H fold domain-containing protein n=1 Tax=Genlisea aurea TaxID=192259 RepID=S8CHS3_9LAMI|nr:hypothetical protein M569_10625 [Genlisea aurea]